MSKVNTLHISGRMNTPLVQFENFAKKKMWKKKCAFRNTTSLDTTPDGKNRKNHIFGAENHHWSMYLKRLIFAFWTFLSSFFCPKKWKMGPVFEPKKMKSEPSFFGLTFAIFWVRKWPKTQKIKDLGPKPPKTTQNHSKPLKTTQNRSKPLKTTQNHPKPLKTTQNHSKPPKTTGWWWGFLGGAVRIFECRQFHIFFRNSNRMINSLKSLIRAWSGYKINSLKSLIRARSGYKEKIELCQVPQSQLGLVLCFSRAWILSPLPPPPFLSFRYSRPKPPQEIPISIFIHKAQPHPCPIVRSTMLLLYPRFRIVNSLSYRCATRSHMALCVHVFTSFFAHLYSYPLAGYATGNSWLSKNNLTDSIYCRQIAIPGPNSRCRLSACCEWFFWVELYERPCRQAGTTITSLTTRGTCVFVYCVLRGLIELFFKRHSEVELLFVEKGEYFFHNHECKTMCNSNCTKRKLKKFKTRCQYLEESCFFFLGFLRLLAWCQRCGPRCQRFCCFFCFLTLALVFELLQDYFITGRHPRQSQR